MPIQRVFAFEDLGKADLYIDAIYKGGEAGNTRDDPISKLVGSGNQGGFRFLGKTDGPIALCVLYSSLADLDWPDALDVESGILNYYGDNKRPGHDIHYPKGNRILRNVFADLHTGNRQKVPPFLIFTKGPQGRDVLFRGLAVPGADGLNQREDLVAVWRTRDGQRFQNYRAVFTILDEPVITRGWIDGLRAKEPSGLNAPINWLKWVDGNKYRALTAPRTIQHRTLDQQLPAEGIQRELIKTLTGYFRGHPRGAYAFEECAASIASLMDSNIVEFELTRPWRDGGRDALGKYRIGHGNSGITVEFALEAKCYDLSNGCGIRESSRLISRIRHRQFGILVTTSYLAQQAYKEIVEDGHPIVVLAAIDIAEILIGAGYNTSDSLKQWLIERFPPEVN